MPKTENRVIASCSFCLKRNDQVKKLVAGPGVYICDECVGLCNQVIGSGATSPAPSLSPWEQPLSLHEALDALPRIAAAGDQVEGNLHQWVLKARELGATWAAVGDALGITRQSAWERFSSRDVTSARFSAAPTARVADQAGRIARDGVPVTDEVARALSTERRLRRIAVDESAVRRRDLLAREDEVFDRRPRRAVDRALPEGGLERTDGSGPHVRTDTLVLADAAQRRLRS